MIAHLIKTICIRLSFLDSLAVPGLLPHRLSLKIGAPIILLHNLNTAEGLCNGTKLIYQEFHHRIIEAEIMTGLHADQHVFFSCITLTPTILDLPFVLKRHQFPVHSAFAMTIIKHRVRQCLL